MMNTQGNAPKRKRGRPRKPTPLQRFLAIDNEETFDKQPLPEIKRKRGRPPKKTKPNQYPKNENDLTPKQERFIQELVVNPHVGEAARKAGYKNGHMGYQLVRFPNIARSIAHARQKMAEKLEMSAEKVLREYIRIGYSDVRTLFAEDGTLRNMDELDDDVAASIASVEIFEEYQGQGAKREYIGRTKRVKFWDKPKALENLGKHLGLFPTKHEVSGQINVNQTHMHAVAQLEQLDLPIEVLRKIKDTYSVPQLTVIDGNATPTPSPVSSPGGSL